MGTLTAGQPRLDHYCEHKLPTSCRLSSIGECCACYDNRAHSASYRTYVDGVGYVLRGTRWQSYCWFCKTFWENRVDVSGLRPGQTRIPQLPDQGEFLTRWYEFHQGYRIVTRNGNDERVAVLGEDLRDVSPGFLPRTVEELRVGQERSELEDRERDLARQQQSADDSQTIQSGPTLEDTLDQLFQAASSEEEHRDEHATSQARLSSDTARRNVQGQAMTPAASRNREYQARRIATLRRELHRMRNGIERVISGLRELGENVPDHTEASARLSQLGRTLDNISDVPSSETVSLEDAQRTISSVNTLAQNVTTSQSDRTLAAMQARVDQARQEANEAQRNREQAALELDAADQEHRAHQLHLQALQANLRSTENYMRLFGTREEMAAQGENYESPIGGMFTRAMDRFRAAEEVRREERTLRQVLEDEDRIHVDEASRRLATLQMREPDVWGVPQPPISESDEHLEEYHALLNRHERQLAAEQASSQVPELRGAINNFPSNMLDGVLNARQAELDSTSPEPSDARARGATTFVAGPPGRQLDPDPLANNDRGHDALFVLRGLLQGNFVDATMRPVPDMPPGILATAVISRVLQGVEDNSLSQADVEYIEILMRNEDIIWGLGLPAERNRRRRTRGENITFTPEASAMASAMSLAGQIIVHDVEVMAECFQISAQVRGRSGLSTPEQMLSRLQGGGRNTEDRAVLAHMLRDEETLAMCSQIHEQHGRQEPSERQANLVQMQRDIARRGDHSRAELDAQRRATGISTALAASRLAMGNSPTALFERLANRDEATRAAYQRLQDNGFDPARAEMMATTSMAARRFRGSGTMDLPASVEYLLDDSTSDQEDVDRRNDRVGLDAKDTGRPEEPMTEDQMTVLLDCRICYSQKAEICTLPCGHLTMCKWCSDQHSPTMAHDATRPRRAANCPVCRKQIKQKVKVIRA